MEDEGESVDPASCAYTGMGGRGLSALARGGAIRIKDLKDRTGRSIPPSCE